MLGEQFWSPSPLLLMTWLPDVELVLRCQLLGISALRQQPWGRAARFTTSAAPSRKQSRCPPEHLAPGGSKDRLGRGFLGARRTSWEDGMAWKVHESRAGLSQVPLRSGCEPCGSVPATEPLWVDSRLWRDAATPSVCACCRRPQETGVFPRLAPVPAVPIGREAMLTTRA